MLPPRYNNALTYKPRMIRPSRYPMNALAATMPEALGGTMGGIASPQAAPQGSPEAAQQQQQAAAPGDQYGYDGQGTFTETSLGPNPGKANTVGDLINGPGAVIEAILGGPLAIGGLVGRGIYSAAMGYENMLSTPGILQDLGAQLGIAGRGSGPGMGADKPSALGAPEAVGVGAVKGEYGNVADYMGNDGGGYGGGNQSQDSTGGNSASSPGGPSGAGETEGGNAGGNSRRHGGFTGDDGDGRLEPMQMTLHEGEYVIRPEAVAALGRPLLDMLNREPNALLAAFAQRPPVTSWMQGAPIYPNDPPTRMPEMMPEGPGQRAWDIPPSPTWFSNALRDLRRI